MSTLPETFQGSTATRLGWACLLYGASILAIFFAAALVRAAFQAVM